MIYDAKKNFPPLEPNNKRSQYVLSPEGVIASFDYEEKVWKDCDGNEVEVSFWRYLPPNYIEPEDKPEEDLYTQYMRLRKGFNRLLDEVSALRMEMEPDTSDFLIEQHREYFKKVAGIK